jgi:hypothetical protein
VLGDIDFRYKFPHYLTAAGANVIGGTRCNPDMQLMSLIDPERRFFSAWNRFGIVQVERAPGDEPKVMPTSGLSYTIALPLTAEWVDKLGIRYIVQRRTTPRAAFEELNGFVQVGDFGKFGVFARKR